MRLIIDTREVKPLPIKVGGIVTELVRSNLAVGDYMTMDGINFPPNDAAQVLGALSLYLLVAAFVLASFGK